MISLDNNLKEFKDVLKIIANRLDLKWTVIGSTNLALQGMDVKPRDLDIVVRFDDLEKVRNLLKEYNPSPIRRLKPMTNEPAWEIRLDINGVKVQILGELDDGEYVSKRLADDIIYIDIGLRVPCFTLDAEARAYAETNREEKAKLIRKFLKSRDT